MTPVGRPAKIRQSSARPVARSLGRSTGPRLDQSAILHQLKAPAKKAAASRANSRDDDARPSPDSSPSQRSGAAPSRPLPLAGAWQDPFRSPGVAVPGTSVNPGVHRKHFAPQPDRAHVGIAFRRHQGRLSNVMRSSRSELLERCAKPCSTTAATPVRSRIEGAPRRQPETALIGGVPVGQPAPTSVRSLAAYHLQCEVPCSASLGTGSATCARCRHDAS